jgi:hypothetical protein
MAFGKTKVRAQAGRGPYIRRRVPLKRPRRKGFVGYLAVVRSSLTVHPERFGIATRSIVVIHFLRETVVTDVR